MLDDIVEGNYGKAWCFLNIADPFVAWETYRGEIISSDYYHDGKSIISPRTVSVLRNLISEESSLKIVATNELLLESVRQNYFSNKVSRLTGAFLFANKTDAERAILMWGNTVSHFNSFALTEVNPSLNTYFSKLDSNWITFNLGKVSTDLSWMHHYWSGEACPESREPLWEIIASSRFYICNKELQMQAYKNIRESFYTFFSRKTLPLLEDARLAAYLGSDLGHSAPYLIHIDKNTLGVRYIISMVDANNPKYLERLSAYLQEPRNAQHINYQDLNIIREEGSFAVPDLRSLEFNFKLPDTVLNSNFKAGDFAHSS